MARAKEPHPGTLKRGLIMGSSKIPKVFINPVRYRISDATKKGKSDGNTTFSHRFKPFEADSTAVLENIISESMKIIHTMGTIRRFR